MLQVTSLNQFYGGSHILRDVSLHAPQGKITTLLGRNGVGKTTLLKCLTGQLPIRSGTVRLDSANISAWPSYRRARAGMAYVPQGREIFPRLTVLENLRMGQATLPARTPLPQELFELFPVLGDMLTRRGGDLSGGQQQQLAIARALAMKPRLLILDEPTEGIQPSIIKDIERAIRRVAASGNVTILLVEQYYDFAASLADHYLVMERGEIVAQGAGQEMASRGVRDLLAV